MYRLIARLFQSGDFDAVHADQLWMAQYALAAKRINPAVPILMDQHNAVYLVPQRLADGTSNPLMRRIYQSESGKLARYEAETCRAFDHVVWVTEEDRAAVARVKGDEQIQGQPVIPICVDPEAKPLVNRVIRPRRVTFLGGLHWPPNADGITWFYHQVWPHVRAQVPDALFTVIGKDPPAELPRNQAGVEVTGYVDDVTPFLEETAVFVVPLHAGGGMRVKIIDAWSWGLPIVSTSIGAEGIRYTDGKDCLIADTADAFARYTVHLLEEERLASELGQNGRETIEKCYDWRTIYRAWDQLYPR